MLKQIQNLNDVEIFAKQLVAEGTNFHPDDDFGTYVTWGTNKKAFTKKQAALRNALMDQSFDVCEKKQVDIYNFMLETFLKETGMDKFVPLPSQVGALNLPD